MKEHEAHIPIQLLLAASPFMHFIYISVYLSIYIFAVVSVLLLMREALQALPHIFFLPFFP